MLLSPIREANAEIDWSAMAGMRDKLIHDYIGIDYDIVFDVVTTKLPPLREILSRMLRDLA